VEKAKKEKIFTGCESGVLLLVYLACFCYGASEYSNQVTSTSPLLVMLSAVGGMVLAFLPYLSEKILKIHLSIGVNLAIQLFGLMGIALGETLDFYYHYSAWDNTMHFLSGFGVSLLAYAFLYAWKSEDQLSHPGVYLCLGAFLLSLAVGFLWEIYEFSFDTFFGTDMQKTIPEGVLFNGGNSFAVLNGSDADLAAFFRSAQGYRYAITDTMNDLVDCLLGSLLFQIIVIPLRKKKPDFGANLIRFLPRKNSEKSTAAAKPL
jgi:hypothetical protein